MPIVSPASPRRAHARRSTRRAALALLVALAAAWWVGWPPAPPASTPGAASALADDDLARLRAAWVERRGDLWVTLAGTVERVLPDDDEGSRHQRFVVRVADDLTLLVAHNIDIAERVPLAVGDAVVVRGEYEWNAQGGVLHWTHRDPQSRSGGWVEHGGRRYE